MQKHDEIAVYKASGATASHNQTYDKGVMTGNEAAMQNDPDRELDHPDLDLRIARQWER